MALGCADPYGQFDEFTEALAKRPPPPALSCGEDIVQEVEGTFFAVLAADIDMTHPVMAVADITTGATGMQITLHTLNAADRQTEVGDAIELPTAPVDDEGAFSLEHTDIVVVTEANPFGDGDIVMPRFAMRGTVCEDLICGSWSAQITTPITYEFDIETSQFALVRVGSGEPYPEPPPFNCAGDLAPPLP